MVKLITADTDAWNEKLKSGMEKNKAGVRYDSNQIIWKRVKWFHMNEKIDAFFYEGNIAYRFIASILFLSPFQTQYNFNWSCFYSRLFFCTDRKQIQLVS